MASIASLKGNTLFSWRDRRLGIPPSAPSQVVMVTAQAFEQDREVYCQVGGGGRAVSALKAATGATEEVTKQQQQNPKAFHCLGALKRLLTYLFFSEGPFFLSGEQKRSGLRSSRTILFAVPVSPL